MLPPTGAPTQDDDGDGDDGDVDGDDDNGDGDDGDGHADVEITPDLSQTVGRNDRPH